MKKLPAQCIKSLTLQHSISDQACEDNKNKNF